MEVRSREGFEVFGEGREVGVDPAVHLVRGDDMIRGHRRQPRSSFRLPFVRPRIGKRGIFLTRRRAYGHQRLLYSPSARARERERTGEGNGGIQHRAGIFRWGRVLDGIGRGFGDYPSTKGGIQCKLISVSFEGHPKGRQKKI